MDRLTKWLYPIALLYLFFLLVAFMTMPTTAFFSKQTTIGGTISVTDSIYGTVTDATYGQTVTDLVYGGTVTQSVYHDIMNIHIEE